LSRSTLRTLPCEKKKDPPKGRLVKETKPGTESPHEHPCVKGNKGRRPQKKKGGLTKVNWR